MADYSPPSTLNSKLTVRNLSRIHQHALYTCQASNFHKKGVSTNITIELFCKYLSFLCVTFSIASFFHSILLAPIHIIRLFISHFQFVPRCVLYCVTSVTANGERKQYVFGNIFFYFHFVLLYGNSVGTIFTFIYMTNVMYGCIVKKVFFYFLS